MSIKFSITHLKDKKAVVAFVARSQVKSEGKDFRYTCSTLGNMLAHNPDGSILSQSFQVLIEYSLVIEVRTSNHSDTHVVV